MPREITITLYQFDELPTEKAKERARDWWRSSGTDLAWSEESRQSIEVFCGQFGIRLLDYQVGPYNPFYFRLSDYDNSNFRGVSLTGLEREKYPTGYCLDADMSIAFYDVFKATGDAKSAFKEAVEEGFRCWRNDMEWQCTDEYIDDCLIANGYEFTESGNRA